MRQEQSRLSKVIESRVIESSDSNTTMIIMSQDHLFKCHLQFRFGVTSSDDHPVYVSVD